MSGERVSSPLSGPATSASARPRGRNALLRNLAGLRTGGIYLMLVILVVAASLFAPAFLSTSNITNIMRTVAIVGVVAAGQTIVAIAGGLADLSVGSVIGLTGALALGLQPSLGMVPSAVLAILVGVAVGLVNGVLIGKFRTNPVVTTIGTSVVVSGIALLYTGANTIFGQSAAFTAFGTESIFDIPNIVSAFVLVVVATHLLLSRTAFGRRVYATGGNYEAARASGVRVQRVVLIAFAISALMAAVGGVLLAALLAQINYDSGASYTFNSIAAVAVGGTSLFGGSGSVVRTVAGILIIGILNNVVVLLGLPLDAQVIVTGVAILAAVVLDVRLSKESKT